jgi:type I restriction enzyme M protein
MSSGASYLSLTDVARLAGVRPSAVSNWRTRHVDFPEPTTVSGQEVFDAWELVRWLQGRQVPRNRLAPGEQPETTYGDRVLLGLGGSEEPSGRPATRAVVRRNWQERLFAVENVLRDRHDTASSLEFLLGLVYLRACRLDVWRSLVHASDRAETGRLLSQVTLPAAAGGAIPVFRAVDRTADPAVAEAIRLVDAIDFGPDGPAGGQVADAILADLERRLGRSGGQFTPPDLARCLVELLDPGPSDRVYDPFCGSGELLSAATAHVARGSAVPNGWRVFGQTPHEWAWRTARMNLALQGVGAELDLPGDALLSDAFPDRQFSIILTNPPFNTQVDPRGSRSWPFGEPNPRNGNLAWLQHVVTKLEPGGRAAVVMPLNAAFNTGDREVAIRQNMIEAGVIECVVALPAGLFRFTGIPAMVWILRGIGADPPLRETLLIDAKDLGEPKERHRRLDEGAIRRIVEEYRRWRAARGTFTGSTGFSLAVSHDEIAENGQLLVPRHYVDLVVERLDAARVTTRLDAARTELQDLARRAEETATAIEGILAGLVAGDRPPADGGIVPLGDICDVLAGPGTVPRSGQQATGTPLVLPRNIRDNRVGRERLDVVPEETEARLSRYRLAAGDIVSARTGTLGRYGQVAEDQRGWLLGPGCVRFRPDDEVEPYYLTSYLGGPAAPQWMKKNAAGSTIPHISTATWREMPIWLPSRETQRATAEILRTFDTATTVHGGMSARARDLHGLLVSVLIPQP